MKEHTLKTVQKGEKPSKPFKFFKYFLKVIPNSHINLTKMSSTPSNRSLLALLATGTFVSMVAQSITQRQFLDKTTHVMPWIKASSSFIFALASKLLLSNGKQPQQATATTRQKRILLTIGIFDTTAYTAFTIGFFICGATLATLILAGLSQIFTALATQFITKRTLNRGQMLAVVLICMGFVARGLPAYLQYTSSTNDASATRDFNEQVYGISLVCFAAFLYASIGILYEKFNQSYDDDAVKREGGKKGGTSSPSSQLQKQHLPHHEVLWWTSFPGFLATSTYQLIYNWPQIDTLITTVEKSGTTIEIAGGLLLLFATVFNVHYWVNLLVFKSHGAVAVGVVNAVRGAVIAGVSGVLFCSPSKPKACLTISSAVSAVITSVGGVVYAMSRPKVKSKKA